MEIRWGSFKQLASDIQIGNLNFYMNEIYIQIV